MKRDPQGFQQRMNHFQNGLRRSGVKLTHQRLEIFREVAKSSDHPDAETVFSGVRQRILTVSLDTVYRTLWLLLDLGLITTLGPTRERMRFDANLNSHHHFFCLKCRTIRDFYSPEFDHLTIPEAVEALGRVEKAQVEVRGLCRRCSKKKTRIQTNKTSKRR